MALRMSRIVSEKLGWSVVFESDGLKFDVRVTERGDGSDRLGCTSEELRQQLVKKLTSLLHNYSVESLKTVTFRQREEDRKLRLSDARLSAAAARQSLLVAGDAPPTRVFRLGDTVIGRFMMSNRPGPWAEFTGVVAQVEADSVNAAQRNYRVRIDKVMCPPKPQRYLPAVPVHGQPREFANELAQSGDKQRWVHSLYLRPYEEEEAGRAVRRMQEEAAAASS
jgi:hypothetical protein